MEKLTLKELASRYEELGGKVVEVCGKNNP